MTAPKGAVATCGRDLATRPWWMGEWQYAPCPCLLPFRHEGDCKCSCDLPANTRGARS